MGTSKITVLTINGSEQPEGVVSHLLRHALHELESKGIYTEMLELGLEPMHDCLDCQECTKSQNGRCKQTDDATNGIIQKMREADGILLCSPASPDGASRRMKSLLDRACMVSKANGGLLRHKVGASLVTIESAHALRTFDLLNHFFLVNEMIVAGSSFWQTGIGFDCGELAKDPRGLSLMETLVKNMAWLLQNLIGPMKLYESLEIVSQ